jgi:uncharacterized cupin superfamily protein
MGDRMIAALALDLPARTGTDYPAPHNAPCLQRIRRALGDVFGLSQFGVNMLDLPPGTWSSQRHWHEQQDEFVYVLEGELVLVTDEGETVLRPGMVAGFRAGTSNGHHLVNRSDKTARVLEVGTHTPEEVAYYSDIDMMVRDSPTSCDYLTKDGRPLK